MPNFGMVRDCIPIQYWYDMIPIDTANLGIKWYCPIAWDKGTVKNNPEPFSAAFKQGPSDFWLQQCSSYIHNPSLPFIF